MDTVAWQAIVHGVAESDTTAHIHTHTHTERIRKVVISFCLENTWGGSLWEEV